MDQGLRRTGRGATGPCKFCTTLTKQLKTIRAKIAQGPRKLRRYNARTQTSMRPRRWVSNGGSGSRYGVMKFSHARSAPSRDCTTPSPLPISARIAAPSSRASSFALAIIASAPPIGSNGCLPRGLRRHTRDRSAPLSLVPQVKKPFLFRTRLSCLMQTW